MQLFLGIEALISGYLGLACVFVYSPFAKTWRRALWVPFVLVAIWGALSLVRIIAYREDSPPGFGFIAAPFMAAVWAAATRCLKILAGKLAALVR
jgi:hypothetical protein